MKDKTKTVSEPVWGGSTATANMLKSADWLRANRGEQIKKGIEDFRKVIATGEVTGLTRRSPLEYIRHHIKDAAHTIRSWHAWGEPSEYGKAVCARLREEIICYAAIKRVLEKH